MTDQASLLADAQRSGATLDSFDPPADLAQAEAIQDRMVELLGIVPGGWKLGATTAAVRARLGLPQGFIGLVPAERTLASGCTLARSDLRQAVIELEIAFVLGRDLPARAEPWSDEEAKAAIAGVCAAFELPESRFATLGGQGPLALVADNGASGWIIAGETHADWDADALAAATATIDMAGATSAGDARDIVDGPFRAFTDLLRLAQQRGHGLKAGHYVLTGACAFLAAQGEGHVHGRIDGVGTVEFTLA